MTDDIGRIRLGFIMNAEAPMVRYSVEPQWLDDWMEPRYLVIQRNSAGPEPTQRERRAK